MNISVTGDLAIASSQKMMQVLASNCAFARRNWAVSLLGPLREAVLGRRDGMLMRPVSGLPGMAGSTGRASTAKGVFFLAVFITFCAPLPVHAGDTYEEGIAAYRDTKYQNAVRHLRVAADGGNTRAQEILGFMHLHGPSMYGAAVPQDRAQAIYWFGRAAKGGREVAQHMLCVLNGKPGSTVVDRSSCAAASPVASTNSRP